MNNLTVIMQLRCEKEECQEELRAFEVTEYGMRRTKWEHIGEPCRNYYGKDPATHEGFPNNMPYPIRRCAVCWNLPDGSTGEKGDPVGRVTTRQEAWGDRTTCSHCDRQNYYSIGD